MATATTTFDGIQPRYKRGIATPEALVAKRGVARNEHCEWFEDFLGDVGQTIPAGLVATKTGTSTNNTVDYVAGSDGKYALTHSADSEAQTMRVDGGDTLAINMSKKPKIEIRAKINFAGATFSADQRAVFGLSSAYAAALDDATTNAWFRVEGASLNILIESDDGTTDDDDNDSGIDLVDDTFVVFEIDCSDLSAVKFYVDGVPASSDLDMSALSANTLVQPIVAIQRDAGTEQEVLTLDYIRVTWERT